MLAAFIVRLFGTQVKGWMGEKAVAAILSSVDEQLDKVIKNQFIAVNGKTVQIDHVTFQTLA